jgi:CubicO group peptidase (beta-lactamase class C family)
MKMSRLEVDLAALSQRIEGLMETAVIPGLSIALIDDGQLAWAKGFGVADVRTGEPVTPDTIFEAASLTKPVFAYLAMQLVQEGVLKLDVPLVDYLPEGERTAVRLFDVSGQNESAIFDYVVNETAVQQITLRHVLSHQPGFPNWTEKGTALKSHLSPGQRFSYSGDGFHFLQKILAYKLGMDLPELLHECVLLPLDMGHTHPMGAGLAAFQVAVGHDQTGEAMPKWNSPELYAAASLHTTPSDYAEFLLALLRPDKYNAAHLHPLFLQEMLQPQVQVNDGAPWHHDWPRETVNLEPNLFWGLGWGLERRDDDGYAIWHWGDNGNFKAFVWGDMGSKTTKAGTAVVLMANSSNGDEVWRDILTEIVGGHFASLDWLERMAAYNSQQEDKPNA